MNCIEFEDRLNDLLDDRLAPADDAALLAHAATCTECREMLAAQESLFHGLATLSRRTHAPEIGKQVLRELHTTAHLAPPLPPPPRRSWFSLLVTAAAVLVAVGLSIWIVNRGGDRPIARNQGPRGNNNGLAIVVKPGVKPSGKSRPAAEVRSETAPSEGLVASPQKVGSPTPAESEAYKQAMASLASASQWSSNPQWLHVETLDVEQYAPGIRPIRESFEVALDALLKTIPSGKRDTRNAPPQAIQPHGEMFDVV